MDKDRMRRNFQTGHVPDNATLTVRWTPPPQPVAFTQDQADYLKKVFLEGPGGLGAPASMDDAVKAISWAALDAGQREVINHIQSLVDEARKVPA